MTEALPKAMRVVLQALAYLAFAAFIGYFSISPAYRQLEDDQAVLKLSFSHPAQLRHECRERSEAELAKLAPNMRTRQDCPRERSDVLVELDIDGQQLFKVKTPPLGLRKDGAATVYRRLAIPAGQHRISARLADGPDGLFNYHFEQEVDLKPGQVLIVDFLAGSGGFVFIQG
ncbi:MAG: hypothetical protein IAE92_10900 [Burkholderiaceae bacterium]|nr:hypothetical protein [Burkholderiaceae bacterium]